jgi:hypothetical protein
VEAVLEAVHEQRLQHKADDDEVARVARIRTALDDTCPKIRGVQLGKGSCSRTCMR